MSVIAATERPIRPEYLLQAFVRHATLARPPPSAEAGVFPGPRELAAERDFEAFVEGMAKRQAEARPVPFASASEAVDEGLRVVALVKDTIGGVRSLGEAGLPPSKEDAAVQSLSLEARAKFDVSGAIAERGPDGRYAVGAFALTYGGAGFAVRIGSAAEPWVSTAGQAFEPYRPGGVGKPPPVVAGPVKLMA